MGRAADVAIAGIDEAVRRGAGGSDGALLVANAAEALIRIGRLAEADRIVRRGARAPPPATLASYLVLAGAEVDLLRGRLTELRPPSVDRGPWPSGRLPVPATDACRRDRAPALGPDRPPPAPDVRHRDHSRAPASLPVSATRTRRSPPACSGLGVRADADARTMAEIADEPDRLSALIADGHNLRDRCEALLHGDISEGERRQVRVFLAGAIGRADAAHGGARPGSLAAGSRRGGGRPLPALLRPVAFGLFLATGASEARGRHGAARGVPGGGTRPASGWSRGCRRLGR